MFFDSISIPENYVGLVIGKKGRTIKKIEIKYGVKILIDNNIFYLYTTNSLNKLCKAKNHITDIYTKKIIDKTITQVRRTNYALNLSYYMSDFYSFQLVMEEFLREPLRYALSQVQ